MKIAVIVDGQAESQALPLLLNRIPLLKDAQLLNPIYADMQPKSSYDQIARVAINALKIARMQKADRTIVLIDLEDQADSGRCVPDFARGIEEALTRKKYADVAVVVKDRKFENWLIADPGTLVKMKGRFDLTKNKRAMIEPDRADSVADAEGFLKLIAKKISYNKRKDPVAICEKADPLKVAANSRSFRKFLRTVGHADYKNQSRKPA